MNQLNDSFGIHCILYLIRDQKAPLSLQDEDQPAQKVPLQVSIVKDEYFVTVHVFQ